MDEVTRILSAIEAGDAAAADELLPLVYGELRRLAAQKLAHEPPSPTFEPTALVHEAYLRLVGNQPPLQWNSRGHFFAAAAEAMRRILVDHARRKKAEIRGGKMTRVPLADIDLLHRASPDRIVALDDALQRLADEDPDAGSLVKLRIFAGLSVEQCAEALNISRAQAYRHWSYARAWLKAELSDQ